MFASGDTEGMVNVFDINENDEDDALLASHNTEECFYEYSYLDHWFNCYLKYKLFF